MDQQPGAISQRPSYQDDEIDLIEIVAKIWHHKLKIVIGVLVAIVLAAVYLFVTPKTYKIESEIAPPLATDLDVIQPSGRNGERYGSALTEAALFDIALGYLQSEQVRLSYWQKTKSTLTGDAGGNLNQQQVAEFLKFHENLTVSKGKKDRVATISYKSENSKKDAALLRGFLEYVDQFVLDEVVGRISGVMSVRRDKLIEKIEQLRSQYQLRLDDQIKQLEEALSIAEKVGIEDTPYEQLANVELNVVNNRFLLGSKTLSSQLEALKQRKGQDAFVAGLRDLQLQLASIEADMAALRVVDKRARSFVIVKPVAMPMQHDSPKALLVMAMAVVLGGVLGLIWLMCAEMVKSVRKREVI